MKKRYWISFILIFGLLIFFILSYLTPFQDIRDRLTGEATNANLAVSVSVTGPPSITVQKPKQGKTYLIRDEIPLKFSSGGENFWYNIDGESNKSVSGNTLFNTTNGQHTLNLYSNNSYGTTIESIIFSVNSTKKIFVMDEFEMNPDYDFSENKKREKKGETTEIFDYDYDELQNLPGFKLHNHGFGKIEFSENVNLTDYTNATNNIINISKSVNISNNRIEINSSEYPGLNGSATLYLYNLTYNNPRILRDGEVCPDTICTIQEYSNGILIFDVTQFSVYGAEETPILSEEDTGGGSGSSNLEEFSVTPEEIRIDLIQREVKREYIAIENTQSKSINVEISALDIEEFVKISESSFSLEPGETKNVSIDFFADIDVFPNIYLGKILIKSDSFEKEIFTKIELESLGGLFDVEVKIPNEYLEVSPGEDLFSNIRIYNLGAGKRVDAQIEYMIRNENNEMITSASDAVAVETSASLTKSLHIPKNTSPGRHILYVRANYEGKIASSSVFFNIKEPTISLREKVYILIILFLIIIITIMAYLYLRVIDRRRIKKKIHLKDLLKI